MDKELRIIYLGTPEFAVAPLELLHKSGYNIVAVITAPDKPAGRGRQLQQSAVKQYAVGAGLPVLQPTNLKAPEFVDELKSYRANLQIVVAFRMLPEVVWNMPEIGTFNLHASLLPAYRGAAPINWAIINGEEKTGVTTFFLKHEIDTGDLLLQEEEEILPDDNVGTLYNRLMHKGAQLVLKTVQAIQTNSVVPTPQAEVTEEKKAPKLFKANTEIIPANATVAAMHNNVRGLSPYPSAWVKLNKSTYKLYKTAKAEALPPEATQRDSYAFTNKQLWLKATDGWLEVLEFQPQGKKRMAPQAFLLGNQI